ncbi:MAG: aminotransferase class I/II-fold pyridoxal phosphate-dependent enzyme, partial [Limnobacter sp.]|nr:aminotransferase class I/II-fold pyridoxal phosphate-dependent enzyme [Limnobacter sp.]
VLGPQGRGLGAQQSPAIEALKAQGHWLLMGTFSKALGVSGAYLACSQAVKDYLINRCTGFVYSTAPSPFCAGAIAKSLELVVQLDAQRAQLLDHARTLRTTLHSLGLNTGNSSTHIVPVLAGTAKTALRWKAHLLENGLVCSAIRPPTVPPNTARLRLALHQGISPLHLKALIASLAQCIQ